MSTPLPLGQRERADFPRFGLMPYAKRFPRTVDHVELTLAGDALAQALLHCPLQGLTPIEQCSDFHCVTSWSCRSLPWHGFRFAEFFERVVQPRLHPGQRVTTVLLRGQDGYRTTLPLCDMMVADVRLATHLHGQPLSIAHGAPLRLVAPAHYGFKSVKHPWQIEFWLAAPPLRQGALAFMDHPRARVAQEERARWLPGWLLRYAYRPLIKPGIAAFAKAEAERGTAVG